MSRRLSMGALACTATMLLSVASLAGEGEVTYDTVIRNGTIYDGSGGKPYKGNIGIKGDRIAYVGRRDIRGSEVVDAGGKAVAPGFINVLSWAVESLFEDGRAQSDLRQGVTLLVFGERSMGPLNEAMAREAEQHQVTSKFPITWRTLNEYMETLEKRGVSVNFATNIGAGTVRSYVMGGDNLAPTPDQLDAMKAQVRIAMEDAGALGLSSALLYVPGSYASTAELGALAKEAGRCGGIYSTHVRSEAGGLLSSLAEVLEISRISGAPSEIYHFKSTGEDHTGNMIKAIEMIDAARAQGTRITTNMYAYEAANTGLHSIMPTWVQEGSEQQWLARLRDPEIRARVAKEMLDRSKVDFSPLFNPGGEDRIILRTFRTEKLMPYTNKTLGEVARLRGTPPAETAIDLVVEDNWRVFSDFFVMDPADVERAMKLDYMSFGSDASAISAAEPFIAKGEHPRAYGNFARILAKYVREDKVITLPNAIRRMTAHPAAMLGLQQRGSLKKGNFADVVIFDPATIKDNATYTDPHQYATGVSEVFVNGTLALKDGVPTDARPGRVARGRGWKGWPDGGCRASAGDWNWPW